MLYYLFEYLDKMMDVPEQEFSIHYFLDQHYLMLSLLCLFMGNRLFTFLQNSK
jgi:hypothetical protein